MTAVWTSYYCPAAGIAFSRERREFHRLKNRAALPQTSDFDSAITLAAILQPGADDVRWSHNRAARIEGYVVAVGAAGVELANCYAPCRRDTHINLALRPDAPASEQMVVEITPRMQDWARQHGRDWSPASLKRDLLGHWCSFEGWLFFDVTHAGESENTAPRRAGNWRATAWEIHPVTNFQIIY
jgi:hypothetical protein